MIIKIPIYVEVNKIEEQEAIPELVTMLGKKFTTILRGDDRTFLTSKVISKRLTPFFPIKVIQRDKALDYLRTSK